MSCNRVNSAVGERAKGPTVDESPEVGVRDSEDGQSAGFIRAGSVRKRRKAKSAKLNTDSGRSGAVPRRVSSARVTRSGSLRRTGSGRYNSKKLSKRKKISAKLVTGSPQETSEYKRDFDEAIAKLTNPNLLNKANPETKTGVDTIKKSSSTSELQENEIRKYGPPRRVRSAQNVVGPRPHSTMGNGVSGPRGNTVSISRQTLGMDNSPVPSVMKDTGSVYSRPFYDTRPSTASGSSGRASAGNGMPEVKGTRPISANAGVPTAEKSSMIQSRLRTYFSGGPSKSGMASTFKTPIVDTYSSDKKGTVSLNGSNVTPLTSKTSGSGHWANGQAATPAVKLRTTTSVITLQPINGLGGGNESHSVSDGGAKHAFGVKAKVITSNLAFSKGGYDANHRTAPRPILKSADVTKTRKKRSVRFALPEDEEELSSA